MNQSDITLVRQPIPQMDKIYAVLDQIEADPEHWNQGVWSSVGECGTSMCFAGWACKLEGLTLAVEIASGHDAYYRSAELANGKSISDAAMHILGLTDTEAYLLFVYTLSDGDDYAEDEEIPYKEGVLKAVKVQVAKISARAKEQQAAFERVAKELIESVPELENVLKPSYLCPESRELVMQYLGGKDGGN